MPYARRTPNSPSPQVVGRERTVPSPLEVTRPASETGDLYRSLHEKAAQMRGALKAQVGGR